jgi:hypothetical protein
MQHMPKDVLLCVLSYTKTSHSHCLVSQQWCSLTHLRKLKSRGVCDKLREVDVPEDLPDRIAAANPISMDIHSQFSSALYRLINPVLRCDSLRSVKLVLYGANDISTEHISQLGALQRLTNVDISLGGKLTAAGVRNLSVISGASDLKMMSLDLHGSPIGDAIGCLREFRNHANLTDVRLFLFSCDIRDEGVEGLAEVSAMRALRVLSISLFCNPRITVEGARELSRVALCPSLVRFTLGLDHGIASEMRACSRATARPSLYWNVV